MNRLTSIIALLFSANAFAGTVFCDVFVKKGAGGGTYVVEKELRDQDGIPFRNDLNFAIGPGFGSDFNLSVSGEVNGNLFESLWVEDNKTGTLAHTLPFRSEVTLQLYTQGGGTLYEATCRIQPDLQK